MRWLSAAARLQVRAGRPILRNEDRPWSPPAPGPAFAGRAIRYGLAPDMAGEALLGFGAGAGPMAFNDHTDWGWDERVLRTLGSVAASFRLLCAQLTEGLARFGGYADRYSSALGQVDQGHRAWVDAPDRESCHILWIQFHEDLLATLGIPRGPGA